MTIRNEQLERMQDAMASEYHRRLMKFFQEQFPELVQPLADTELRERIAHAVSKARSWGLNSGEAIAQCVAIALAAGLLFFENPSVRTFMASSHSDQEIKLRRLLQLVASNLNSGRAADITPISGLIR